MNVDDIANGIGGYLENSGSADYITLIEWVGIVQRVFGGIVGILVAFIMIMLPLVIGVEVCYINFPLFQDSYERLYNRLKGKQSRIFGLVIRDARMAVERSKTTEMGQSPNWIYLKIKCKAIFICFFIIFMVLGPGQFLIAQASILAGNILNQLF